ncbi:MAG: hypothetical protein AAF799_30715 [Myxococcota bacterium]
MGQFEGFPRTDEWLSTLPDGLDSYPEAVVKGSFVRGVLENPPEGFDLSRLPEPVQAMFDPLPLPSGWVPEAHMIALNGTLREAFFGSDEDYLDWGERNLRATLSGPLYRVIFAVLSPGRLSRGASKRWRALRRGTEREHLERNQNGNLGRITYPENLYERLYLDVLLRGLRTVYGLSGAKNPVVNVLEYTPTYAVTEVIYDRSKSRGPRI